MTKFTERLEHDLSQIADRATPSSTAWESIQQRIAEQDSEPTMEVIMLNPDPKTPPVVSRTWMAAAAALILIIGIGGLIALLNRDDPGDTDTVDEPDVTVPLELDDVQEPEVIVPDPSTDAAVPDDEESSSGVVESEEPLVLSGGVIADCNFGAEDLDPDDLNYSATQSCRFRESNVVPFEAIQQYVFTRYDDPEFHDSSAVPFVPVTGLSDSGFMYAGYMWDGQPSANTRFVGVAEGVGPYEGMLIYVSGRSFGDDGGRVHMQWATEEELPSLQINGTDVEPVEVNNECQITGFVEDTDADPQSEQLTNECTDPDGTVNALDTYLFGPDVNTLGIGSYRYALTTGSLVNSGLIPRFGGAALSAGIAEGTGDNEGLLLHQLSIGTITAEGDLTDTTIQVALPPAE